MPVDSRYYFLSSLPMLRFGDKAPLSWDAFMDMARGSVGSLDMKLLVEVEQGVYSGCRFLRDWQRFCDKADCAVNSRRSVALGKADSLSQDEEYDFAKFANAVMAAKNPLDAELLMMKFRFDYLEKAVSSKAFSQDVVLAYALELRILLRKDLFNVDLGNTQYRKLFDKVCEEINVEK